MEQKTHFKLHKVKKNWVIIGVALGGFIGFGQDISNNVQADVREASTTSTLVVGKQSLDQGTHTDTPSDINIKDSEQGTNNREKQPDVVTTQASGVATNNGAKQPDGDNTQTSEQEIDNGPKQSDGTKTQTSEQTTDNDAKQPDDNNTQTSEQEINNSARKNDTNQLNAKQEKAQTNRERKAKANDATTDKKIAATKAVANDWKVTKTVTYKAGQQGVSKDGYKFYKIDASKRNDGIYANAFYRTAPNSKKVGNTKDYNGQIVYATKEITVLKDDGNTVPVLYVNLNGQWVWIDKRAFISIPEEQTPYNWKITQTTNYKSGDSGVSKDGFKYYKVNSSQRNDGIYANAFYRTSPNSKKIGDTKNYNGKTYAADKEVIVTKDTGEKLSVLHVYLDGQWTWIDKRAFIIGKQNDSFYNWTITKTDVYKYGQTNVFKNGYKFYAIKSETRNDGIYDNAFYRTSLNSKKTGDTKNYNGRIVYSDQEITVKKDDGSTLQVLHVNLDGKWVWVDKRAFGTLNPEISGPQNPILNYNSFNENGQIIYKVDGSNYGKYADQAAAEWNKRLGRQVFVKATDKTNLNDINLKIYDQFSDNDTLMGTYVASGRLVVNTKYIGDTYTGDKITEIFEHEFGHAMGLNHTGANGQAWSWSTPEDALWSTSARNSKQSISDNNVKAVQMLMALGMFDNTAHPYRTTASTQSDIDSYITTKMH
ncbi:GW dipeptide domain-containing protein [Weissella minor]|uniref:GW dipeptide domain-containing protein n=1 Tax=Weissella minor TaxID=1620 RepID=UPI003AF2263A